MNYRSYESQCIASAIDEWEGYSLFSGMRDNPDQLQALYGHASLERVARFVADGWVVTGLSPTGKTRYRLSERTRGEIAAIRGRYDNIIAEAAGVCGLSSGKFSEGYEERGMHTALWTSGCFDKVFDPLARIPKRYSGMVHHHLADRYNPNNREQKSLVTRGLAAVHFFCGKAYLSATGELLAMRMKAMQEAGVILDERKRKTAATRERNLLERVANPRLPERPSFWLDLLPAHVARQQVEWEKSMSLVRMKKLGLSIGEIANRRGISTATAYKKLDWAKRIHRENRSSPVEAYFAEIDATGLPKKLKSTSFTFSADAL